MKLGVIHYNFPGFSFEDFLNYAAEVGYQYVELQCTDVWTPKIDHPEAQAEKVRALVEKAGIKVSALSAHNDFVQLEETAIRDQATRMRRVVGLARILGTQVLRTEGGQPKDSVPEDQWADAIAGCCKRCLDFLEEEDFYLAIDNHGYCTNDGDRLLSILKQVGSKRVGTNLDTMNYRWFGHDLPTINRYYEDLAPHVIHTHMKDGFGSRENYRGAALGDGEIDLQHALSCLRNASYQGVYCAEYEGPEAEGGVGYRKCFEWLKANVR